MDFFRKLFVTTEEWLLTKEIHDETMSLWRIHDGLYDLTIWAREHPGGKQWIEWTRGTDVTEAFEMHHIKDTARNILPKFFIMGAKTKRSHVTFNPCGFFHTLRTRVNNKLLTIKVSSMNNFQADVYLFLTFLTAFLGLHYEFGWLLVSGLFLGLLTKKADNFLHQSTNFRMLYFNFSLMSYRDRIISHIISHHCLLNTVHDYEYKVMQKFNAFPGSIKYILAPILAHLQFFRRISDVLLSRKLRFRAEELVCVSFPVILTALSGHINNNNFQNCLRAWMVVTLVSSLLVNFFEIWHNKFTPYQIKGNLDFGEKQLKALENIKSSVEKLHYLFPTIDSQVLPELINIFKQTCQEFGLEN